MPLLLLAGLGASNIATTTNPSFSAIHAKSSGFEAKDAAIHSHGLGISAKDATITGRGFGL